jgi:hypothetical protein
MDSDNIVPIRYILFAWHLTISIICSGPTSILWCGSPPEGIHLVGREADQVLMVEVRFFR